MRLRELSPDGDAWQADAQNLLAATQKARAANSESLWRDQIAVTAFAGREAAIASLVDYACVVSEPHLERVLNQPALLTAADLRHHLLEAKGDAVGASVPLNKVMIATFFLVGLDIGHRVVDWFGQHAIDWQRAMVLICGVSRLPPRVSRIARHRPWDHGCHRDAANQGCGRLGSHGHAPAGGD